jgi:hypothetical protein
MKNIFYKTVIVFSAGLIVFSCKPKLDEPMPEKGSIDATKYVAIGNSITAGFADNALYYDGQMVSYANLLAGQLKLIGGGEFKQPLMPMTSVGAAPVGTVAVSAKLVLGYKTDCNNVRSLSPLPAAASGDAAALMTNISSQGPFNNMGVPGAKSFHVGIKGYGFGNPFFKRMATAPMASMLEDAAAQNPTFFSLFIGNNDVLGYASSGGTRDSVTISPYFDGSIDAIVAAMTANGAKGVIGNIPDITSLPYFTTVPYNGFVLDATSAAALNAAYGPAGMSFKAGNNPFIIKDSLVPAFIGVRQIKSTEYLLLTLPQDSLKCGSYGKRGIPNKYVLTQPEVDKIRNAIIAFNAKLKAVADAKGLAYVDVNAFMAKCKAGIVYNGVGISTTFVSGGAFSLDGVHLTPLGNAMLANEFINAINSKYGSTIPQVDASKYKGVSFP